MKRLEYVKLPFNLESLPKGWFSKGQVNILYQLVTACPGRILEIGPWIGRSTAVICEAISQKENKVEFHTVDYGISSEEEWRQRFGSELRRKPNAHLYLPHINQEGGSIASLERNLEERGFRDLVHVHRGDFHDHDLGGEFSLIFCDATHNINEIETNVPALLSKLDPDNGILACDDIRPEFESHLMKRFDWKWAHVDSLLFYGKPTPECIARER